VSGPSKLRTTPVDSARIQDRLNQLKRTSSAEKKPLSSAKLQSCLRQLRSQDERLMEQAVEELAQARPDSARGAEVAKVLREVAAAAPNGFVKIAGYWVASVWDAGNQPAVPSPTSRPATPGAATPAPVAGLSSPAGMRTKTLQDLERELESDEPIRIQMAMSQVAMRKTVEAAELLVRHFDKQPSLARASLMSMGPVAAPAAAGLLATEDVNRRVEVLQILMHIGTAKELDAVEKLLPDSSPVVRLNAAQAQAAIKARPK
jgi:hypothetical protein